MINMEYSYNYQKEDELISPSYRNGHGQLCRLVNWIEIIQKEEKTQADINFNLNCNRYRLRK